MKNWSVHFRSSGTGREVWELEQKINFGLDGEKLPIASLRRHWDRLAIDERKKAYLSRHVWK